jgi:protein subunit release factor A
VSDLDGTLKELRERLESAHRYLRIDELRQELASAEEIMGAPDFWSDPERAKEVSRRYGAAREDVELFDGLRARLADAEKRKKVRSKKKKKVRIINSNNIRNLRNNYRNKREIGKKL